MLTNPSSVYKSASKPNARGYWEPRPELTHPKFSVLTLIFVSSQRIFYKRWNDDPIFPADKEVYLPGDRKPWFRNSDPRARPLACINSIDVRLGHSERWWSLNDPELDTITGPPEFILMFASLRRTEIYNMIEKRLGRGLIASNDVSQFYSEALGDHHWSMKWNIWWQRCTQGRRSTLGASPPVKTPTSKGRIVIPISPQEKRTVIFAGCSNLIRQATRASILYRS